MGNEAFPAMTRSTFEKFMSYAPVINLLRDCGVDAIGILDSMDFIFQDKVKDPLEGLNFVDFVDIVLNMRGSNVATLKDVKEQVRQMRSACQDIGKSTGNAVVTHLAQFQKDIMRQLAELRQKIQNIDSDSEEDAESNLEKYSGRIGGFPMHLPFMTGSQAANAGTSSGLKTATEVEEESEEEVEDYKKLSRILTLEIEEADREDVNYGKSMTKRTTGSQDYSMLGSQSQALTSQATQGGFYEETESE